MSKLVMLSSLPAGGKSTRAKEIVAQGNWVRVNRDLIRTMLHFDKFSGRNEGLTVDAEVCLVSSLLDAGINVVVDDCNLNPKNKEMWREIARVKNAKFEIEHIATDWKECVQRDYIREKSVGSGVITGMALQYDLIPLSDMGKGIIIIDIDGTVADCEHRLHYVQQEPKDWKGFFSEMDRDSLREDTMEKILEYIEVDAPPFIVFVTARPEEYRQVTEDWIRHNIMDDFTTPCLPVIMRRSKDTRPDTEVKEEIYEKYFSHNPVLAVFDDRPSVIRMWRSKGLEVIDCGNGVEF